MTHVIAFFVQYRVNRAYRGIGGWLLGSSFMALGFIFMLLLNVKHLAILAKIANPLVSLGYIFLYIGIMRFLNEKLKLWIPISIFAVFNLSYYYYMYVYNDISGRTVSITATIAIISFIIAHQLFFKKDKLISRSVNFTAAIFLFNGFFYAVRSFLTIILPSANSYLEQGSLLIIGLVVPIVTSSLWTFGLIIMINQRLNIESKQAGKALMESEEKYRSILNASPDDITITDLEGRILMNSPAANKIFGYEPIFDSFIGMHILDFIVPEDVKRAQSDILQMFQGGKLKPNEYRGVRKDQSIFDIEINSGFIHNASGQPIKMVFIIRDITERKLAEQHIQELVHRLEIEKNIAQLNSITDSLTGLANHRYFDEALKTEFYRLKRSGSTLSLIMLDIDLFKRFNDTYGHVAGDECLRLIGTKLKTIVERAPDIVARYGGEEFVVILPETDENGAKVLGERIRKAIEELAIPHSASDISEYVTVSLGIVTVYTTEFESPEQVVELADKALYCAKKEGRNRCCYN